MDLAEQDALCLQEEDEQGNQGVNLSKQLVKVAGRVLKLNITRTAPLILPLSQKLQFLGTLLQRKASSACSSDATSASMPAQQGSGSVQHWWTA